MKEIEFNKTLRPLNKQYYELFETIPVIQDYICTREEYIQALTKAIEEQVEIGTLLTAASLPEEEDVLI